MGEVIYLSLGSNLGNRKEYLEKATKKLSEMIGMELLAESLIYKSIPIDCPDDCPEFFNKVLKLDCSLKPVQLLDNTERLEQSLGRAKKGYFVNRVIDIDIILFGERSFKNERLEIPHPRMAKRGFVLVPLCEIEPDLTDPISNKLFSDINKDLGNQGVVLLEDSSID